MPELPAVERGRALAAAVLAGRRIEEVRCARDPLVFEGVSPARIRRTLEGRLVRAARRRGKHVWLELDARPWPLFHFGMTGGFRALGSDDLQMVHAPRLDHDAWPPRFTKIRLVLDDGGELVMIDARRLGRIRLRHDPPAEPPVSRLGFDALLDLPSAARLGAELAGRRVTLKGLLLDQSFAAGVGNWIADEVLYQAGLDPRRPAGSLSVPEVRRLRARLSSVVRTAVGVNADLERFPRDWLFHHRWGRQEGTRTARGEEVCFLTIAGRTTAWVPAAQR
ncbi:MAG: DNA-formamidopyrimidine glycosylase family protein [Planctomycetota bacterium]